MDKIISVVTELSSISSFFSVFLSPIVRFFWLFVVEILVFNDTFGLLLIFVFFNVKAGLFNLLKLLVLDVIKPPFEVSILVELFIVF